MSLPESSWSLLPPELLEYQIGQIDLLTAMYPSEGEVTIMDEDDAQDVLQILRDSSVDGMPNPKVLGRPPVVEVMLNLAVTHADEGNNIMLQLDVQVPFFTNTGDTIVIPDEAPRIRVRARQPSWLTRTSTTQLNLKISESEEDVFGTIQSALETAAAQYLARQEQIRSSSSEANEAPPGPGGKGTPAAPLVRVWFYFPSISTRSKRDDFIINAPNYGLTGFLCAGKPGLLCVEGSSVDIDDYMKFIKTESWGDIPAHHKKVSERHREEGIRDRAFGDMQEITDALGERRGQRANRGDMKAMEGWLVEKGLGDAFAKVFM